MGLFFMSQAKNQPQVDLLPTDKSQNNRVSTNQNGKITSWSEGRQTFLQQSQKQ